MVGTSDDMIRALVGSMIGTGKIEDTILMPSMIEGTKDGGCVGMNAVPSRGRVGISLILTHIPLLGNALRDDNIII